MTTSGKKIGSIVSFLLLCFGLFFLVQIPAAIETQAQLTAKMNTIPESSEEFDMAFDAVNSHEHRVGILLIIGGICVACSLTRYALTKICNKHSMR